MSDILSDEEKAALAVGPDDEDQSGEVNDQQQTEEQQQADRARDEQGRFAKKEEGDGEQVQQRQSDGKVPQGALHAERERRKASDRALEEANTALERIRQLRAGTQQQEQQQAPKEDESEVEYLRRELEALKNGQQQTTDFLRNQQFDQAENMQLASALNVSENEFRQDHPDYDAAIEHVVSARAQELALYGMQPVQIDATIREEIAEIARSAIQQKKNPAEVGYQLAKLRGYVPQAGEQQQQTTGKAAAQVAAVARAQAGSRSLGQAAGGATAQSINADTIARMTQDEFDALYATPDGKALIDSL